MKLIKRIGSVVLVGVMILSLSACSGGKKAKRVSSEEYIKYFESVDGYSATDMTEFVTGDNVKEMVLAGTQNDRVMFSYYTFTDAKAASDYFDDGYNQMSGVKDMPGYNGKITKSSDKFTINATYTEDGESDSLYIVCVKADDMVISALAESNDENTVKEVDKVINDLCY